MNVLAFRLDRSLGTQALALFMVFAAVSGMVACSTAWIPQAEQLIQVAMPIASGILSIVAAMQNKTVSATDLGRVQAAVNQVNADFQLAAALIHGYTAATATTTIAKINAVMADLRTNLAGMLTALHIVDQQTRDRVTAIVNLLLGVVDSVESILPVIRGAPVTARARMAAVHLNAKELKAKYNAIVTAGSSNASLDVASRATALP